MGCRSGNGVYGEVDHKRNVVATETIGERREGTAVASGNLGSSTGKPSIGTCRWNVGMTRFLADPARALMGRPKPGSSVKHYTGGSASDTSVAERESGATAALVRIRERSRRRHNALDPCGHRRS